MTLPVQEQSPREDERPLRFQPAGRVASELPGLEAELLDRLGDAVIAIDAEERVLYWGPGAEQLYGLTAPEMLGEPLGRAYRYRWKHPSDEKAAYDRLAAEGIWRGRVLHELTSGRLLEVEATVSVWRRDPPHRPGYVAILRDVTERARAEAAVEEADRRKNDFLAVLSHELRNPLTPLRNAVHLLRRVPTDSERGRRALGVLERQTDHLARLVDDLLDVTRISRGKVALQREPLDLSTLVEQTCGDHRALFEARRIALVVMAEPGLRVDADSARIRQVVGNLLQNALKFSPDGTRVEVHAVGEGLQVRVSVQDQGVGIGPELLSRLFTPFVQVRDGVHGGLGLGLALVKGLVELHGGTVAAESAGTGRGACFTLRLPQLPSAEEPGQKQRGRPATRGRRILVIEDNPEVAGTLAELLEFEGHTAMVAATGRAGIELARSQRPEVVICDLGLPDIDGNAVARAIRADLGPGPVRLIALSGYGAPEDRAGAEAAGFDEHFTKPPVIERLLAALEDDSGAPR